MSADARTMESFRLDGKVAVVTGGASGIGCAIVQRFARSGACIRILDIDYKQAEAVALDVASAGGNASAFQCDHDNKSSYGTRTSYCLPNTNADGDFGLVSMAGQPGSADSGYANGNSSKFSLLDNLSA